jgi:hypothetical protein
MYNYELIKSYLNGPFALLGGLAGELAHSLGALGHGVLGELSREHQLAGRLDLARRERGLGVVGNLLIERERE